MRIGTFTAGFSIVLILLLFLQACDTSQKQPLKIGSKAPEFTLYSLDGQQVSLSQFRGKVVLIEFWATWCPPCRLSIPELEKLNQQMKGEDFVILSISIDEGEDVRERLRDFLSEFNVTYTVLLDDGKVSKSYGVLSIPTIFILDKELRLSKKYMGYSNGLEAVLFKEVKGLLRS